MPLPTASRTKTARRTSIHNTNAEEINMPSPDNPPVMFLIIFATIVAMEVCGLVVKHLSSKKQ